MTFDKIIANPPYGKLHLKVLSKAIAENPEAEIVNLSPIRWLQDPLAEYKKNSDWKRFVGIRERLESLDEITAKTARKLFCTKQYENLGIYHLTKDGGANLFPKPFISQALFDKVNLPTYQGKYKSLYDAFEEGQCDFSRPFVKMSILQRGIGKASYSIINPKREAAFASKVAKGKGTGMVVINFGTQEEAENFFDYCQTDFVKACNGNVRTNIRWPGYAIPFMPTYSHPWDNKQLYEYFGLTPEEIEAIENEV